MYDNYYVALKKSGYPHMPKWHINKKAALISGFSEIFYD